MNIKIPGVGKKTEEHLSNMGIETLEDLVKTYPRKYTCLPIPKLVTEVALDEVAAITAIPYGKVIYKEKVTLLTVLAGDFYFTITWFHPPFTLQNLKKKEYVFYGKINAFNGNMQMVQPAMYEKDEYMNLAGKPLPIYSLTAGLKQFTMQKAISEGLSLYSTAEHLSLEFLQKHNMLEMNLALKNIHNPTSDILLKRAIKRLKFEEFYQFKTEILKTSSNYIPNRCPMTARTKIQNLINNLPFQLTNAQLNAWKDIEQDVTSEFCMSRLVQGDVGSGKTIISFLALFLAAENTYQGVLMAPTEVLATQHYNDIIELIQKHNLPYSCTLLVGSTKGKKDIYKKIESGEIDIIIGTHAIIQEQVVYKKLGMVITDEQHRFGVEQRKKLQNKGDEPHTLLLSATPIPRSLGLVMYGDMKVSIINELPANRLPNKNLVLDQDKIQRAWNFIHDTVKSGHQAYIICPMVEENENFDVNDVSSYVQNLRSYFPSSIQIGMLHGKMNAIEKNKIMSQFEKNEIQVLVSTTVIEVGVNVPNATVILIENAERFGLSQLHQLRGRVGRGGYQGYCIFVNGTGEPCERLDIISSTNDGFKIAEADLQLRGVGDMLGSRQSGDNQFKLANIYKDTELLKLADSVAKENHKI